MQTKRNPHRARAARLTNSIRSAALLLVLAAACGRKGGSGLDSQADSMTAASPLKVDTIFTSARNAKRLALVRDLEIGGTADSASADWIRGLTAISTTHNGSIALLAGRRIKFFDSTGRHIWSTSPDEFAPGQARNAWRAAMSARNAVNIGDWIGWLVDDDSYAPGAISSPISFLTSGDTIAVLECCDRVQLFNLVGRSIGIVGVERTNTPAFVYTDLMAFQLVFGAGSRGWLMVRPSVVTQGGAASRDVQEFTMRRISVVNGALGPPLAKWTNAVDVLRLRRPGAARDESFRPLVTAPMVFAVSGGFIFHAHDDFSISVFDEFGRHAKELVVDTERVRLGPQVVARFAEARALQYRNQPGGDSSRLAWRLNVALPRIRELPLPEHLPSVSRLWVGDDGSVAVERGDLDPDPVSPGDSTVIDILGPDGRYRGRVAVPPGLTVHHFTGRAFFAVEVAGELTRPALPVAPEEIGMSRGVTGAPSGSGAAQPARPRTIQRAPVQFQRVVRLVLPR